MKKSKGPENIIKIMCKSCGKVTNHYLTASGDYKCVVCQTVNKSINLPKKDKEVAFDSEDDGEIEFTSEINLDE